jgi:hypothetical protein
MESAFQAVHDALPKLENKVIEFLAEWLVALFAPARHVLETRSPHLSFMLLGTIIEQNGEGLLEESHMPVGWPLHIDGAVRQRCIHRDSTLQELDDLLSEYDMKRDLAEINLL